MKNKKMVDLFTASRWHMITCVLILLCLLLAGCATQANPEPGVDAPSEVAAEPDQVPTRTPTSVPTATLEPTQTPVPCLASGDQNAIMGRLRYGDGVAVLCQGAVFKLTGPVVIDADHNQIYTEGNPTDERRAVLKIASPLITSAIIMADQSDVTISHLVIDGSSPEYGKAEGDALVFAGGNASGQVFRALKLIEPRSWSALHLIEPCDGVLIEDNDIGPAGLPDGNWADGISLSCTNSIVRNNRIVDATDGAIVIFGASAGSIIEDNLIRAETRTLLGGIHLVDGFLNGGDYSGVIVRNNVIESAGAVIRIGVAMGPRVWLCLDEPATHDTVSGATVINNVLRGDQVQYGFIADGVQDWTVLDNIDESTHIGWPAVDCRGRIASPPKGFQYYLPRAEGTFQPEFEEAFLELALWAIKAPEPGGGQ